MSANQESEKQRLSELTTSIRWKGIREREAGRHVTEQRTKNLYWDMQHAHKMEDHQHVELAIYPSMLLQKRPGYKYTGSGLRGSQFLDKVNGKTDVEAVYVHTLTDVHDFDKPLSGTVGQIQNFSGVVVCTYIIHDAMAKTHQPSSAPHRSIWFLKLIE